jgi:hypothetical protein
VLLILSIVTVDQHCTALRLSSSICEMAPAVSFLFVVVVVVVVAAAEVE